jgi:hypothetical protein
MSRAPSPLGLSDFLRSAVSSSISRELQLKQRASYRVLGFGVLEGYWGLGYWKGLCWARGKNA